jgi:hypothetical protein
MAWLTRCAWRSASPLCSSPCRPAAGPWHAPLPRPQPNLNFTVGVEGVVWCKRCRYRGYVKSKDASPLRSTSSYILVADDPSLPPSLPQTYVPHVHFIVSIRIYEQTRRRSCGAGAASGRCPFGTPEKGSLKSVRTKNHPSSSGIIELFKTRG